MGQELGNFVRGVQASPERAGVSVTGALLRLAGDQPSGSFTRGPVSVRLTRGLGQRLGASEIQVLNRRPVSLG